MRLAIQLALLVTMAGCSDTGNTFTLYRNSVIDSGMRVHIATFDASDGGDYNQKNCFAAADLFQRQPGVTVRYWCEAGEYRP